MSQLTSWSRIARLIDQGGSGWGEWGGGPGAGVPGHECSQVSPHLASLRIQGIILRFKGGPVSVLVASALVASALPDPVLVASSFLTPRGPVSSCPYLRHSHGYRRRAFLHSGPCACHSGQRRPWDSLKTPPVLPPSCQLPTRPPSPGWFWPWQFTLFITQWYLVFFLFLFFLFFLEHQVY